MSQDLTSLALEAITKATAKTVAEVLQNNPEKDVLSAKVWGTVKTKYKAFVSEIFDFYAGAYRKSRDANRRLTDGALASITLAAAKSTGGILRNVSQGELWGKGWTKNKAGIKRFIEDTYKIYIEKYIDNITSEESGEI